jgi:hypothetical protein
VPSAGIDLIGGDLFEIGSAVPVVGEPAFRGLAIPGEMQEFRAIAKILQDADHADRGALDELETQITLNGIDAADRDHDGARLAEITLVQGETGRRRICRPFARRFLPDQPADAVAAFPGGEFLPETSGGFRGAVRVADNASQRGKIVYDVG